MMILLQEGEIGEIDYYDFCIEVIDDMSDFTRNRLIHFSQEGDLKIRFLVFVSILYWFTKRNKRKERPCNYFI